MGAPAGALLPTASAFRRLVALGATFSATSPIPSLSLVNSPSANSAAGTVAEQSSGIDKGVIRRRRDAGDGRQRERNHSNVGWEENVGMTVRPVRIRSAERLLSNSTPPSGLHPSQLPVELDFSALLDDSWSHSSAKRLLRRPPSSAMMMSSRRLLQSTSRRYSLRQLHTSPRTQQGHLEETRAESPIHPPAPTAQSAQNHAAEEGHAPHVQRITKSRPYAPYPSPSTSFTYSNSLPPDVPPEISTSGSPAHPAVKEEPESRQQETPQLDEINSLLRHPTLYDPLRTPRLPIVLCHGLYGFDVRGPAFFRLHYWGDLLKILRGKVGSEVIVAGVPGTGAVKQRAHAMNQTLEQTASVLGRDLNFLAHSMGGLDSRYLFSSIHPTAYHPRSLTTLCTPHRGSEFMSWCRANIGIGTDFDAASEAAASALHHEAIPLPFSLKAPVLTRAQKEAKDQEDKAKATQSLLSKLPFSISSSLSSYLLDLLDSPAYANLTPSFLNNVFNPSTPDRTDISYYSVAARTPHIPIWHPLWLPKLVLDGASKVRVKKGLECEEKYRGNDGLVNVESAMWGHFLGVIDDCDHWEMRGGSGLEEKVMFAKAAAEAVADKAMGDSKSWQWQDVYALVGKKPEGKKDGKKILEGLVDKVVDGVKAKTEGGKPEGDAMDGTLNSVAGWITRRLPGNSSSTGDPASRPLTPPTPPALSTPSPPDLPAATSAEALKKAVDQSRLQYGAPVVKAKPEKFDLERMTIAVCRKLYDDGF